MVAKRNSAMGRPPCPAAATCSSIPRKGPPTMTPSKSAPADGRNTKKGHLPGKGARPGSGRARTAGTRKSPAPTVLPGEDARAYRGRLRAWTGSLGPRNPVELYLVERAVALSWQLDRADRAQLERLSGEATRGRTEGPPDDDSAASHPIAFDDSDSGERLRRHQRACGRALDRTLHTFARLREIGEAAELAIHLDPVDSAPEDADDPALTSAPHPEAFPPAAAGLDVLHEDVAALAMILAALEPGGALPMADLAIIGDPLPDDPFSPRSPQGFEDEDERPRRPHPSSRRRGHGPSDRQVGWSTSRGPSADAGDARRGPACRTRPRPESASAPAEGRRRVGGYEVPLDCSTPVSCADRIPVRLRREAAARR